MQKPNGIVISPVIDYYLKVRGSNVGEAMIAFALLTFSTAINGDADKFQHFLNVLDGSLSFIKENLSAEQILNLNRLSITEVDKFTQLIQELATTGKIQNID